MGYKRVGNGRGEVEQEKIGGRRRRRREMVKKGRKERKRNGDE